MIPTRFFCVMALAMTAALCQRAAAQVQTEVPPAVPGAKPVTVERIKVRGAALEGNLEGNPVARDVLVFLPPSYAGQKSRRYPVLYALHGYSIGAEQWAGEILNGFEVYQGTHTSKVADRFQNHVMPFFSQHLCFRPSCR